MAGGTAIVRASPILTSFNAGELSQNIDGRSDLTKYFSGCHRIEGFLPIVQGPAVRRGGFRYVSPIKDQNNRAWLIKFEYSATQSFMLEFGDQYVRFYTLDGVLLSGPNPYEIVSPYALADLTNPDGTCALNVEQSGDVLYIANAYRTYAPRKLTRLGDTNWTFTLYQPVQGPFLEQNDPSSSTTTIYASASTGSITLTASAALFVATDVGRLVRLELEDVDISTWEVHVDYTTGDLVRFDGKTYKALNTATSGTNAPVQEHGTSFDGKSTTGVQWLYQDSAYGVARITAFTDSTHVTATVIADSKSGLKQMPANLVGSGNASTRWSLGAWSDTTEYPACVKFFRNRLFWTGKLRFWGTVPNDYENMAGDFFNEITDDCAIWLQLTAQDVNDILWIQAMQKLVIGTGGGEFTFAEASTTAPLSPTNYRVDPQTKKRVRAVSPIVVGSSLLYVQRSGRKLLGLDYRLELDSFVPTDLAVLSDRMTRSGILGIAYQGEPYSIIWSFLENGKLVGFTYDKDQDVTGWHRHPVGGTDVAVESVCVGPSVDGSRDQLWAIIKRTINGQTCRYVEIMERPWESPDEDGTGGDAQQDAFYVDSGLTYSGGQTQSIFNLGHLERETVQILANGAVQPDQIVMGGQITLTRPATVVQIGLKAPCRLVTMRLEGGGADGTSQGKIKRIDKLVVRFLDTALGKCGLFGGKLDDIAVRHPSTPMGEPEPFLTSQDVTIDFAGEYETDNRIEIRQDAPVPITVAAIMPRMRSYP